MPTAKSKNETNGEDADSRQGFRTSDRVEARLNPYIEAHSKDLEYYKKLISENPERAARTLMLKDLEKFEETMKRVNRQMPQETGGGNGGGLNHADSPVQSTRVGPPPARS